MQIAIDGARLIADRTGVYAGQVGPFWCGDDGVWKDVWLKDTHAFCRKSRRAAFQFQRAIVGSGAIFVIYADDQRGQPNIILAESMPDVMLAKCAESLALRKAFPQELSGIYTSDEMGQADNVDVSTGEILDAPPRKQALSTGWAFDFSLAEFGTWLKEQGITAKEVITDSNWSSRRQEKQPHSVGV